MIISRPFHVPDAWIIKKRLKNVGFQCCPLNLMQTGWHSTKYDSSGFELQNCSSPPPEPYVKYLYSPYTSENPLGSWEKAFVVQLQMLFPHVCFAVPPHLPFKVTKPISFSFKHALLIFQFSLHLTHTRTHTPVFPFTMLHNYSHYESLSVTQPWNPKLLFEVLPQPIVLWDL